MATLIKFSPFLWLKHVLIYKLTRWHTTSTDLGFPFVFLFSFSKLVGLFRNHKKALYLQTDPKELLWHDQKRCKTQRSPMIKTAPGSCNATERQTTALRTTTHGITSLPASCSHRASGPSDDGFGGFSNNANDASGELWGAPSSSPSRPALSVSSGVAGGRCSPHPPWHIMPPSDNPATRWLNPAAAPRSEPGAEHSAGASRQRRSSPVVGRRFDPAVGRWRAQASEADVSSAPVQQPFALGSCRKEGVEAAAAGGSERVLPCPGACDVWLPNSQWGLGKGRDLFGWSGSLARSTKDGSDWSVVWGDVEGNRSPGGTAWADSVPSTDGSSWFGGTRGPGGRTAIC